MERSHITDFIFTGCESLAKPNTGEHNSVMQKLSEGDYTGVLVDTYNILVPYLSADAPITDKLNHGLQQYLDADGDERPMRERRLIFAAIAAMNLFIQNNWTGPPSQSRPCDTLPILFGPNTLAGDIRCQVLKLLAVDGNPIYQLVVFPEYFYFARMVLVSSQQLLKHTCCELLSVRCLWLHQQLLDEQASVIKNEILALIESVSSKESIMTGGESRQIEEFHIEAGHICLYYYEYKKAKSHFLASTKLLGMELDFTGALGKRTKFQQFDITQLVLNIKHLAASAGRVSDLEQCANPERLPKDVILEDDTLLSAVKLTDSSESLVTNLTGTEQALLLGLCAQVKKTSPADKLRSEELGAFLTCVLSSPKVWATQFMGLLLRSQLESDSRRRAERSMMQLQALVDAVGDEICPVQEKLRLFHAVCLPPKWLVEKVLANLLLKLGSVASALEIFERLQLWDDVIACLQQLGRREQAEKIVRKQLAEDETPMLWCILGDLTRDAQYYDKAWEMSGHRSARAQRSLGFLHLAKKEYADCVPCFQKSVEVNPLQSSVWFSLGCSALFTRQYELAATALRRCVTLDPENSEAWNNLSSVYIKLHQKSRAHKTLQEALKLSFENWKIWENYLLVSIDCGEFEEVINALHRLTDIKEKYTDTEVLRILITAITDGTNNSQGESASRLKPKALELMGKMTSQVTNNPVMWGLYAQLTQSGDEGDAPESKDKALNFLQKAHRCATHTLGWEKGAESRTQVCQFAGRLATAYLDCSTLRPADAMQLLSSAKLMLRGVIAKVRQHGSIIGETEENLAASLEDLEQQLKEILSRLERLRTNPTS
ncbi:PREDICTED: tetratricopeptide repeat protein 27-like isoform X2 [Priapulus caudatus]|uniref:Tetratricopeptide repeat protein 27-like isoform X2 n=1 Tax=Priapulus caudatus TaxID=37621 RepID=A0ABM1EQW4_PRICU|nr:PREDICTED: tetratricopeptide repeat protein 27-like isoform X2 [Priapulus caudatus]